MTYLSLQSDLAYACLYPDMNISSLSNWPEIAQASVWCKVLDTYPSTMTRAFQSGRLRGSKLGHRTVLHSKGDILAWLGFEIHTETLPAPAPKTIERPLSRSNK
jgi:hypothetical protein